MTLRSGALRQPRRRLQTGPAVAWTALAMAAPAVAVGLQGVGTTLTETMALVVWAAIAGSVVGSALALVGCVAGRAGADAAEAVAGLARSTPGFLLAVLLGSSLGTGALALCLAVPAAGRAAARALPALRAADAAVSPLDRARLSPWRRWLGLLPAAARTLGSPAELGALAAGAAMIRAVAGPFAAGPTLGNLVAIAAIAVVLTVARTGRAPDESEPTAAAGSIIAWRTRLAGCVLPAALLAAALATAAPHPGDAPALQPPDEGWSGAAPLGTDAAGRDELSQVLSEGGVTLAAGLLGGSLATLLGAAIGVAGARVPMRAEAVTMAVPPLLPVLAFAGFGLVPALAVALMPGAAAVVRAQERRLAGGECALAARLAGLTRGAALRLELLPNLWPPLASCWGEAVARAMVLATAAELVGAAPGGWGGMLAEARSADQPLLLLTPALLLVASAWAARLFGTGLAVAIDPLRR